MRNEMHCDIEKKFLDVVEKLQEDVRRLEIQAAVASGVDNGKIIRAFETGNPPHEATGNFQRCKNCRNFRLPHRTTPRYTCDVRQATIEPKWTCELFSDKNNKMI